MSPKEQEQKLGQAGSRAGIRLGEGSKMGVSLESAAYRDLFFLGVGKLVRERDMAVLPARWS